MIFPLCVQHEGRQRPQHPATCTNHSVVLPDRTAYITLLLLRLSQTYTQTSHTLCYNQAEKL